MFIYKCVLYVCIYCMQRAGVRCARKKYHSSEKTNAQSANICTHAQIKTSTEQKKATRKLFVKNQRHVDSSPTPWKLHPLQQAYSFCMEKVSATLYVFDILNGAVATCQSLFKFAFHIFPLFSSLCFDLWLSVCLSVHMCVCCHKILFVFPSFVFLFVIFMAFLLANGFPNANEQSARGKVSLKVCK